MPWTRQQIEDRMRERIRGFTDEGLNNADADAVIAVTFYPSLSAEEQQMADECWHRIIASDSARGNDRTKTLWSNFSKLPKPPLCSAILGQLD
jgi:hypothetical protein